MAKLNKENLPMAPDNMLFTKVGNMYVDEIMSKLSLPAQAVYLVIIRKTVGWYKTSDKISYSQFKKYTGIKSDQTISKVVAELEENGLIEVNKKYRKTSEYSPQFRYKMNTEEIENLEENLILKIVDNSNEFGISPSDPLLKDPLVRKIRGKIINNAFPSGVLALLADTSTSNAEVDSTSNAEVDLDSEVESTSFAEVDLKKRVVKDANLPHKSKRQKTTNNNTNNILHTKPEYRREVFSSAPSKKERNAIQHVQGLKDKVTAGEDLNCNDVCSYFSMKYKDAGFGKYVVQGRHRSKVKKLLEDSNGLNSEEFPKVIDYYLKEVKRLHREWNINSSPSIDLMIGYIGSIVPKVFNDKEQKCALNSGVQDDVVKW